MLNVRAPQWHCSSRIGVPRGLRARTAVWRVRVRVLFVCRSATVKHCVVMPRPAYPRIPSTAFLCSSAVPSSSMPQRPAVHRRTVGCNSRCIMAAMASWAGGRPRPGRPTVRARALPYTRKKNTLATSSTACVASTPHRHACACHACALDPLVSGHRREGSVSLEIVQWKVAFSRKYGRSPFACWDLVARVAPPYCLPPSSLRSPWRRCGETSMRSCTTAVHRMP